MSDDKSDESDFLNRWSRRKAEARTVAIPEEETIAPSAGAAAGCEPDAVALDPDVKAGDDADAVTQSEEIPPEIADIDIDSLTYDSDFTAFMKDNVPEVVRRRALRQLWRSNPVLANVDGLNDYDEDYTDAALVVKGLKSAYQIGKGYLTADEEDGEGKDAEHKDAEGVKAVEIAEAESGDPEDAGDLDEADETDEIAASDADTPSGSLANETEDDPVREA